MSASTHKPTGATMHSATTERTTETFAEAAMRENREAQRAVNLLVSRAECRAADFAFWLDDFADFTAVVVKAQAQNRSTGG